MTARRGLFLVVSGPSGAGKGTVLSEVLRRRPGMTFSVSATTRAPRDGEENGVHYWFVSPAEFEAMVARGEFLEWVRVHEACYGTPHSSVERFQAEGVDVVLDIDVQGGLNIRESGRDAVFIFLAPPSIDDLRVRLEGRKTESAERIARRVEFAQWELSQVERYDYLVVNDVVEDAVSDVLAIIAAEKLRTTRRVATIRRLVERTAGSTVDSV